MPQWPTYQWTVGHPRPGSKPKAASFFRQFHRSVAAAVKTGAALSSSQTYGRTHGQRKAMELDGWPVDRGCQAANRIGDSPVVPPSLRNWSDPCASESWDDMRIYTIWTNVEQVLHRLSLIKHELYRTILMAFEVAHCLSDKEGEGSCHSYHSYEPVESKPSRILWISA